MKVSLSWLKDYVSIDLDPTDLADALTMAGLEVDSVSERYAYLDHVVVGQIEKVRRHPNADKLKICRVNTGDNSLSIVCGAPNVKEGMLAPVAMPGTVFPDGSLLEIGVIRGQTSDGMLCSEAELGLGTEQSGILSLDSSLSIGSRLDSALGLSDTVFEFDLTPNRPDCLSVIGIAREIAAIQNTSLKYPDYTLTDKEPTIGKFTSVRIEAPDHCPRYAARLLENVTVKVSPFWLQDRLLSVGLRPINNIVDITNFVLMETGQPLHAFDFDRLAQNRIVVRTAAKGEKFVTLDQKERILDPEMLMICDGEKAVAIGGVMGGLNSEIEDNTTRVLIESAYFNPVSIRKTSKKLGLSTDASHRFERGVDPEGTIQAVNRAARLMEELGGAALIEGLIDEYPKIQSLNPISLSVNQTKRLLGIELDRDRIKELLKSIEFKVNTTSDDEDAVMVTSPTFRVDISRPEDLMEEVARLSGYNNIPTTFPQMPSEARSPAKKWNLRNRIKQLMTGFGFTEVVTYSFAHQLSVDVLRLKKKDPRRAMIKILNPLTEDQAVMRTSLLPGLLDTVRYNHSQQIKNLKIFEIGNIFINSDPPNLPLEPEILTALWTGTRNAGTWHERRISCDFYDMKGVAEGLFNALKLDKIRFTTMPHDFCCYTRPGYTAQIMAEDSEVGLIGEIHPQVRERYDLAQTVYVLELELDKLALLIPESIYFKPFPKFPAIYRDITVIVNKGIETQQVIDTVAKSHEKLVERLHLFDVYEGDPIPAGKKSISFRITYRSSTKTLEDVDVNRLHKSITDNLLQAFDATLPV
jgi:phenylalanyl-tRNA synthetase beta chain